MERLISSRNALVLRHGQTWEFAREDQSTHKGGLERSSAKSVIHFEALVNNDLKAFGHTFTLSSISSPLRVYPERFWIKSWINDRQP